MVHSTSEEEGAAVKKSKQNDEDQKGGGGYGSHVGCAPRQKRLFWMLAGSFAQHWVRALERHKPMLRACKYGGISKMYAHQAWVQQLTRTSPRHDDAPGPWAPSHGE